jgi:subtilase family serine protease
MGVSKTRLRIAAGMSGALTAALVIPFATAAKPLDNFQGHPPIHVHRHSSAGPVGLDPATVRKAYNLTGTGSGTIAIIDAYDNPNAEADLNTFSSQFSLAPCTTGNGCFTKHKMATRVRADSGWGLEISLDVQWAHAIAPAAKILLVEAKSASGTDLLNAVNYARNRSDVVAVSMSWGGGEFSSESSYDSYFTSPYGARFFASSGDNGTGASWPAVSPNIVGVGGTTLNLDSAGNVLSETAWSGSGGGISAFESIPGFQSTYGVTGTSGKRAVPDVSYDANPATGFAVYDSQGYQGQYGWFQVGGTSAGAPQWAAIQSLGHSTLNSNLYADAKLSNHSSYLRDIVSGTNGSCGFVCTARSGYDEVTGVGSPVTVSF